MNFNNPSFLYGLFALAIPIIVHLFNFRRAKKVYFSNTQFLQHVKETSSAKRRLKHYLVLFSRLLFILFFVLAFAQPFLPANEDSVSSNHVSIYLDNSFSMQNLSEQDNRLFDEGIEYVKKVIELYPNGTQFRLITNDFEANSNTYKSGEKIIDQLTELKLSGAERSLMEIDDRRLSVSGASGIDQEDFFIVSDFQGATIGSIQNWELDSITNYRMVHIRSNSNVNITVDSLYLENPFVMDKSNTSLTAVVKNYGDKEVNNVSVKVLLNEVQVGSSTISLKGKEKKEVNFDISYSFEDVNKAKIIINDYPVVFDDQFYFIINTASNIEVLELKETSVPTVIEKVYGNKDLFRTTSMTTANVDYSKITTTDLLVLNGLRSISSSLIVAINSFIQSGGRVLIIPSEEGVDKGIFTGFSIQSDEMENTELARPDLNHPFFKDVFEDKKVSFSMPTARNIISIQGVLTKLLGYHNGQSFLTLSRENVFLLGCPLNDDFTNFQNHALFVPVMYKIATYQTKNSIRPYFLLNESTIRARLDSIEKDQIYEIQQKDRSVIPSQRMIENDLIMEIPEQVLDAGFAEVSYNSNAAMSLAFNYDRKESDLASIDQKELIDYGSNYSNVNVFTSNDAETFSNEIKARYLGQPLWKLMIILSLVFLFTEILIIRFVK